MQIPPFFLFCRQRLQQLLVDAAKRAVAHADNLVARLRCLHHLGQQFRQVIALVEQATAALKPSTRSFTLLLTANKIYPGMFSP